MSKTELWLADEETAGLRIDQAVCETYPELSRNSVQTMIKNGNITVNNKKVKPGLKLKGGESISMELPDEESSTIEPTLLDFPIIYEDDDIVVINKPSGLVVHPGAGKEKTTVVSALLSHTALSPIGAPTRPGIVHRLDKETSGIMVLAKNKDAHKALAEAFAEHSLEKEYVALVQGHLVDKHGRIEVAITRDEAYRKRMKPCAPEDGRMAVSVFEVQEFLKGATLVKVNILTGRTHQIRVHMAFTGHPLIADSIYGGAKTDLIQSHFLHSRKLTIKHPRTEETMVFEAPLPKNFEDAIKALRS